MTAHNLRFLFGIGLFFLLGAPASSQNEVRYYDIELVVFENLDEPTDNNEIWPAAKVLNLPDELAILGRKYEGKLASQYDPRTLFNVLTEEEYQLTEDIENLRASGQYRILLHTGWRQPGLARKQAISVYFKHAIADTDTPLEPLDATAINEPAQTPAQAGGLPEALPSPLPIINPSMANLEGLITIVLSRYLHLDVEMLYKRDPSPAEVDMFDTSFLEDTRDKEKVFYLKQNRRMRSKETHYIDHPVFSMLVRITPYELAAAVPATPTPVTPGKTN